MSYEENPKTQLRLLDPIFCEASTSDSLQDILTDREVASFKRDGYLVKRGLIKDVDSLTSIVDYMWEKVPREILSKDDPSSWLDRPHRKWTEMDAKEVGHLHRGNWKMRSNHGIGTEPFILNATANHPAVLRIVEQMIGKPVARSNRVRGVYVVLPKPIDVAGGLGPHVDHAAAQICAMVLLAEIPPKIGGFTIWPGSHRRLHPYWDSCYSAHISEQHQDTFQSEYRSILRTVTPLEFCGNAGDVVFWHPRLIHSAGVNYSAEDDDPRVRFVVPCDFQHAELDFYDDEKLGPGENVQWWVTTRHFREDIAPTAENLWHDWSFNLEES